MNLTPDEAEEYELVQIARANEREEIKQKILFMLTVYPVLNATMLQVAVGNPTPVAKWRPVLDDLVDDGAVMKEERMLTTQKGQTRVYVRYYLRDQSEVAPLVINEQEQGQGQEQEQAQNAPETNTQVE